MQNKSRLVVWIALAALILSILLAMQFQSFTDEVQSDEAVAYAVLFLAIGAIYELWQWLKARNKMYRTAFGVGFFGLFFLGWVSGAVGIIGSENNPINLMYWAVPSVVFIGSSISLLRYRGMMYTLFAAAAVQALIPVIALVISPEVSWGNAGVAGVFMVNGLFVALFAISGLLFRRAQNKKN